jgi:hypothetical protein
VDIGAEAALFLEKEYINGIFIAVRLIYEGNSEDKILRLSKSSWFFAVSWDLPIRMAPTAVPNTEPETSATPTVSLETAVGAGVLQHVPSKKREIVLRLKTYKIQYE